jgi:anti-sigma regulatory factor (Ser/Thr protein kinase)
LAQQLAFRQVRLGDIISVIDEICSNAIEHGSETVTSGIDLTFIWDANRLEILIRDKGRKTQNNWLTTGRRDEVLQERRPGSERGHGIYLAQKLSDSLKMAPNSLGGTDVRIIFYRSTSV